jgi:DivIVA domain-containing protein
MIELTPLDVRKKKDDLRRSVRGYDIAQVDAFLDMVADRLEQVVHENRTQKELLAAMEQQLDAYREREHALNEALLTAQELREEARSQARRESALKLREAEVKAKQLVEAAERDVRSSIGRIEELRSRRRYFLDSFRDTLRRYMEELEIEERRMSSELAGGEAKPEAEAEPGTEPRAVVGTESGTDTGDGVADGAVESDPLSVAAPAETGRADDDGTAQPGREKA